MAEASFNTQVIRNTAINTAEQHAAEHSAPVDVPAELAVQHASLLDVGMPTDQALLRVDMCIGMCVEMYIDTHVDTRIDMHRDMCIGILPGARRTWLSRQLQY